MLDCKGEGKDLYFLLACWLKTSLLQILLQWLIRRLLYSRVGASHKLIIIRGLPKKRHQKGRVGRQSTHDIHIKHLRPHTGYHLCNKRSGGYSLWKQYNCCAYAFYWHSSKSSEPISKEKRFLDSLYPKITSFFSSEGKKAIETLPVFGYWACRTRE